MWHQLILYKKAPKVLCFVLSLKKNALEEKLCQNTNSNNKQREKDSISKKKQEELWSTKKRNTSESTVLHT